MLTRKQYMDDECTHQEYYSELAVAMGVEWRKEEDIARFRTALETDQHMNNIPLAFWDARSRALSPNRDALKARGETWSLSTGVCVLKAAARAAVEKSQLKAAS